MRSKDRLAELQRMSESAVYGDTVELAPPAPGPHQADIDAILQQVDRMRGWIHEMNDNTQLMRRLHADPTFHGNKHLQAQLEGAAARCTGAGRQVCDALRQLEGAVSAQTHVRARIARLQYAATRQLYADALERHRAALDALRGERRDLLHDQLRLTNLTITEEECESLLDSKNISLFVDNVRADTAAARLALREAETRRDELARVERALQDVRDLFLQLAHLVASQQERVDSVEYYALQATEHVETGQHQLLKGTVSRKKAKKKKWSLLICLSAGFLVVLLVLVFT